MWPFDREVPGQAHAAFDHKTVYAQLHGGSPSALSSAVGNWRDDVGAKFDNIHQLITTGLKKATAVAKTYKAAR